VVRTAEPLAVPPPQSPFLFNVPWETEFPSTKLTFHASLVRKSGQVPTNVTNGGAGPVMTGFNPQSGSPELQWVVPLSVEPPPAAVATPTAKHPARAVRNTAAGDFTRLSPLLGPACRSLTL